MAGILNLTMIAGNTRNHRAIPLTERNFTWNSIYQNKCLRQTYFSIHIIAFTSQSKTTEVWAYIHTNIHECGSSFKPTF
jgi:uncharacterized protein Veg